jgi:PKD repeat protein
VFWTPRDTVSVGSTVNFWDYSTEYPTSWLWEFEGVTPATSNEQNPSVTYNTVGTFDVKLTTSNSSGGDNWLRSDLITVVDKPNVLVNSNPASSNICEGDSIVLIASGTNVYEWYDDRGYFITKNDTLIAYPLINTTYKVKGYDNYGGASTVDYQVVVNSLPDFDLGEDINITKEETITLDVGETFSSYLWNDGTTTKTLTVSGAEYGTGTHKFYVTATNSNSCSSTDTVLVTISEITSVLELTFEDSNVKIYPVPAHSNLTVEFAEIDKNVHLYLYDIKGQLMTTKAIRSELTQLNISDLPQGVYLIKLINERKIETVRFVKQ